jgi:hypothetical protein
VKLNTHTGLWTVIDAVMEREQAARRKAEREAAREREQELRRDKTAAGFDRKVIEFRRKVRVVA